MKKATMLACILVIVFAGQASAHVTVQPNEAIVGSFSRFVVRVPNEEAKLATVKVTVELPPLAFVSFEPKEGWKRTVEMTTLDEPIEAFGQEITEVVGSVTWSGGSIGVGEFDEFGFSAKMPDGEETLRFGAVQTYEGNKVVRWTGPPDAEHPAAQLTVYDIGAGEEMGELGVLADINDRLAALEQAGPAQEPEETEESEDESSTTLLLVLAGGAGVLSVIALAVALTKR